MKAISGHFKVLQEGILHQPAYHSDALCVCLLQVPLVVHDRPDDLWSGVCYVCMSVDDVCAGVCVRVCVCGPDVRVWCVRVCVLCVYVCVLAVMVLQCRHLAGTVRPHRVRRLVCIIAL